MRNEVIENSKETAAIVEHFNTSDPITEQTKTMNPIIEVSKWIDCIVENPNIFEYIDIHTKTSDDILHHDEEKILLLKILTLWMNWICE